MGMALTVFEHDDTGYAAWLAQHADGFVLNRQAPARARNLVLHRASCRHISQLQLGPGRWTHGKEKRCADDVEELVSWARHVSLAEPTRCSRCKP
jgi:hypothetical protein